MKKTDNLVGYIAALLILITVVFKINYLPGGGIIMAVSGLFLSVYFPVYILRHKLPLSYAAAAVAAVINLAIVFKIQHWPGAGILFISGLSGFSLVYLPLLFVNRLKQSTGKSKLMYISGLLGLSLISLGILFKIQHWPGAPVILSLGAALLFLGYFPLYMNRTDRSAEEKHVYLRNAFFVIIIGGILTVLFMRTAIDPGKPPKDIALVSPDI